MITDNLTRREREKLRQCQEMLDAALFLFSEKGYHNVSMQEIAEKAEFAVGTIYKFFPSKADLYQTIVLQQLDAFDEAFAQATDATDNEVEKLHCYVRIKSERFRDNLPFIRLFFAERGKNVNIEANVDEIVRSRCLGFLSRLAVIFETGTKNKRFKPIASPFEMAVALDSVVNAFLLLWFEAPEMHPFPNNPEAILNIFFKGLLNE